MRITITFNNSAEGREMLNAACTNEFKHEIQDMYTSAGLAAPTVSRSNDKIHLTFSGGFNTKALNISRNLWIIDEVEKVQCFANGRKSMLNYPDM